MHVRGARDAALAAVEGFRFQTTMTKEQVVARHCYALTYEREHVEEWERQMHQGEWGHEVDDEGHELRVMWVVPPD